MLKTDRLFVANLPYSERGQAIARAIINLAHDLGMTLVAEGVETAEQYALLVSMGCERIQGFYFSLPVAAADIAHIGQAPLLPAQGVAQPAKPHRGAGRTRPHSVQRRA
jgi:EAL domain-containing protein (putative c-di-GMP-specific phosphodiesterase class I)